MKNEYEMNLSNGLEKDLKTNANKEFREETATSPVQKETMDSQTPSMGIITTLVNLREEPTPDAKVVKILDKGRTIEVLDTHREYYKVRVAGDGIVGYIVSKFCKVV